VETVAAATHQGRREAALSSDVILALAFVRPDAFGAHVEVQNEHLVHANNMFANSFWKFVSEQPLCCSPVEFAKPCRAVTKIKKHLMLMPMTRTKRAGHAPHDGIFSGEVISH
jgi:hypothetical protein